MKSFKGCAFLVMLGSGTVFGADNVSANEVRVYVEYPINIF